jgi:hypothetical protein
MPSQERGRSCVCVLGLSYTSCFCDFPLDVRTKQYTENERLNNTNHTNNRRWTQMPMNSQQLCSNRYSGTVNQLMMETVNFLSDDFNLTTSHLSFSSVFVSSNRLSRTYTILVHSRSIWVICVWGLETREKARLGRTFSRVSRRQCTCIVFILQF